MPRKPGLGPRIFRIESMSTGREVKANQGLIDDWTGELIEPAIDTSPLRPIPSPQIAIDARKRLIRDNQRALLIATGIIKVDGPRTPKLSAPAQSGKRVSFQGESIAMYDDMPPWRRG